MKKTLISLAITAGMVASGAAFAEATVYGNVHLSLDDVDTGATTDEIEMNSQTSAVGVKGSEDLGDGMKALYKLEWQLNPNGRCAGSNLEFTGTGGGNTALTTGNVDKLGCEALTDRDQWVGLKGGMGTVKFGTMSSNYKQMGGKIDPMYRTALEGRGGLSTQSGRLHGGAGIDRGRSTQTVQYSSPKMGGMQLVLNTTFSGATGTDEETTGVGFRYNAKSFSAFFDTIKIDQGATSESATKVGGKFKTGAITIGAQFESAEDIDRDYVFLSANYKMNSNSNVAVSAGTKGDSKGAVLADGSTGFAVMYNHKLGKKTNVYVGYGDRSDDAAASQGVSVTTFGLRKKF